MEIRTTKSADVDFYSMGSHEESRSNNLRDIQNLEVTIDIGEENIADITEAEVQNYVRIILGDDHPGDDIHLGDDTNNVAINLDGEEFLEDERNSLDIEHQVHDAKNLLVTEKIDLNGEGEGVTTQSSSETLSMGEKYEKFIRTPKYHVPIVAMILLTTLFIVITTGHALNWSLSASQLEVLLSHPGKQNLTLCVFIMICSFLTFLQTFVLSISARSKIILFQVSTLWNNKVLFIGTLLSYLSCLSLSFAATISTYSELYLILLISAGQLQWCWAFCYLIAICNLDTPKFTIGSMSVGLFISLYSSFALGFFIGTNEFLLAAIMTYLIMLGFLFIQVGVAVESYRHRIILSLAKTA